MSNKKNIILVSIIALILGVLIVRQFYLQKRLSKISHPQVGEALAYQVAELIKGNTESRVQIAKLQEQYDKMQKSSTDLQSAKETLDEKNKTYEIILGKAKTEGPGVAITFNDKIHSTQLVDLLNALKNIGVEAISINSQRITPASSITEGLFNPPVVIQAIGDKNLLADSLTRPGGIVSQIGFGDVSEKDIIKMDAMGQ